MSRFKVIAQLLTGLVQLALVTGVVAAAPARATSGYVDFDRTWQLLALTNAERSSQGLGELAMDQQLLELAVLRAQEITGEFSHTRPNGQGWHTAFPGNYAWPIGENIAFGQSTSRLVHSRWMSSEMHRANILDPEFRSVGLVAWVEGKTVYWVEDFTAEVVVQMDRPGLIRAAPQSQVSLARTELVKVRPKPGGKVVLALKLVSGADGYKVQLARNKKFKGSQVTVALPAHKTKVSIVGLIQGRRYWVKVRPFVRANGKKKYGHWSSAVRFKAR